MDNIPVDSPGQPPISATYQPNHQQPQSQSHRGGASSSTTATNNSGGGGGALNFDENLKDIPQELAGQQQQQQQQQQPSTTTTTSGGGGASSSSSSSSFNISTSNLNSYPSVLAPVSTPHLFSPAPGIPPNAPPQTLPALVQQPTIGPNGETIQPPIKRPRGRPRKIPGVDSRPSPNNRPEGTTAGRGRPKGSRGTRGRGRPRGSGLGRGKLGKRGRDSSDDSGEDDISVDDSSEDENGSKRGGKKGKKQDEEDDEDVDLNEEVDDDFGPEGKVGATTKFGRKISKPKSFVPTNKPTITRKKRQSTAASAFEASLICQICLLGHSPPGNALVICDSCSKGYHQMCHVPILTDDLVMSDQPFFCKDCGDKLSEALKEENVNEGDEWTTGVGEDKGNSNVVAEKNKEGDGELPVPPPSSTAEGGEKKDAVVENVVEMTEEEKEVEKAKPYSEAVKKEWLLSLPLNILVGYVLSIEKKYAATTSDSPDSGLPIWPKDLPAKLLAAKEQRAAEQLERERRLEEEAEALAAAVASAETGGLRTETTNSEAGTPLSFDVLPGESGNGARTAASKRLLQGENSSTSSSNTNQSSQAQSQQQQQQQQAQQRSNQPPAYMRPAIPMASALGGGSDIQVGGNINSNSSSSSSNGVSTTSSALQQAQQAAVAAAAQAQANRYAVYPSYSSTSTSTSQQSQPSSNSSYSTTTNYGFSSGATLSGLGGSGGVAGAYQSPAPGAYANMYAQQPTQQHNQQGGYPGNGAGSPWGRNPGGN